MILDVFARTGDVQWLECNLPAIQEYHRYWASAPRLAPETDLSRNDGGAHTPAPKVAEDEVDAIGRAMRESSTSIPWILTACSTGRRRIRRPSTRCSTRRVRRA